MKNPALSVIMVKKILDACAGSLPSCRKISGIEAPINAPINISRMREAPKTKESARSSVSKNKERLAKIAIIIPARSPILHSRAIVNNALLRLNRSVASCRKITARDCCPVFPD